MTNNPVVYNIFAILRSTLCKGVINETTLYKLNKEQWVEFTKLAGQHNIIPLICDGIKDYRNEIPPEIIVKIVGLTVLAEDKYEERVNVIKQLSKVLNSHNIPLMVLKGYGVSLYYPQPNHRVFSDIDIYNFGQISEADAILKDELGLNIDVDVHHHTTCIYNGVLIENHFDFVEIHSHNSNARFENILKKEVGVAHHTYAIDEKHSIIIPSARFNALFLMRHMALHYAAERISIRHLCDWRQFVEQESQNIDWENIHNIYKQFNMHRFADAITAICIDYLGLDDSLIPNVTRDKAIEDRILNDILYAEFNEVRPQKGLFKIVWWKTRRFFANSWKHKLIYNESVLRTFFQSAYSHLLKPKSIKK